MKHSYLVFLALILIPILGFAQKKPLTIPAQNYPQHYFDAMQQNVAPMSEVAALPTRPIEMLLARGGGGSIWEEDFGGGFPTGWAVDNVIGNNPWKWTANGSHGYWNGTNAVGYADPINSTTASNGFLISDIDSANHFSFGQPSGTTYQFQESYFATNAIDLGASYSSLLLEFEQSFRFNNSVDLNVQVSPDSVNWTTYTVQGGVGNNTASPDPDLATVNISAAVGSSQTVYLRIGWNSRVYFWMIDDMKIVQGQDNDLALTKAYHGDIVLDYQYSKIPLEQAAEMVVGAIVTNFGGITQTNVTVDYDVLKDGASVSTGSFSFPNAIDAAIADTAWHSTGFTPSQYGDYTVNMTVSADNTDENLSNQSGTSVFEVTDSIFAHDYDDNFTVQVWGQATNGVANAYGHGNLFVPPNNGSTIHAIEVAFGSNTNSNRSIIAEVHEIGANIQDIVDTYQTVYDIVESDINGGSDFFFRTIVLDEDVEMTAGTGYIIALQSEGGTDSLWVLGNTGDEDFSTVLYGPYGTGAAINWYNGWNHTPAIRMKINAEPAAVTSLDGDAGFGMFPNPATDLVNISSNSAIQFVSLMDVNGKLIRAWNASQAKGALNVNFDLTGVTPGIYMVSIGSESMLKVEKLIIQ
jgi:hypothetical protein